MNQLGGHKRVSQELKWPKVLRKIYLKDCPGATPHTVKNAYLRYLKKHYFLNNFFRYFEKFEAFMKNLGYSCMNGTGPSSTFSRSSRSIRATYDNDWVILFSSQINLLKFYFLEEKRGKTSGKTNKRKRI